MPADNRAELLEIHASPASALDRPRRSRNFGFDAHLWDPFLPLVDRLDEIVGEPIRTQIGETLRLVAQVRNVELQETSRWLGEAVAFGVMARVLREKGIARSDTDRLLQIIGAHSYFFHTDRSADPAAYWFYLNSMQNEPQHASGTSGPNSDYRRQIKRMLDRHMGECVGDSRILRGIRNAVLAAWKEGATFLAEQLALRKDLELH